MDATRIIAVRHGETAWNVDARIQGHTDIALNPRGRRQAERLGEALASEMIAAIYSSDLSRAHETAQHVARRSGAPLHAHTGLRERGFGRFEGRTFAEVEQAWPDHAHQWRHRVPEWTPPEGGESLLQLRARIHDTVQTLAAAHLGEQIVMVAHGGVLDALYRLATGQPVDAPRSWQLPNAAINRLLWTPEGLTLVGWGDTRHLESLSLDEETT